MDNGCSGADRINSFALVSYIPDPLGRFLDDLRRILVPGCTPHAHVTLMPPRPLSSSSDAAFEQILDQVVNLPVFELEATSVEVFPVTNVVYIELGEGRKQLEDLHEALNTRHLAFAEPFAYHPHITLAQELLPGQVEETLACARQHWAAYPLSKRFPVKELTFVQNTLANRWLDLSSVQLNQLTVKL